MGERFLSVVKHATLAAALLGVGLLVALPRHASILTDFADAFTIAFCFTFLGHYIEALLLALPGIRTGVGASGTGRRLVCGRAVVLCHRPLVMDPLRTRALRAARSPLGRRVSRRLGAGDEPPRAP
jgi:hypothetical protein